MDGARLVRPLFRVAASHFSSNHAATAAPTPSAAAAAATTASDSRSSGEATPAHARGARGTHAVLMLNAPASSYGSCFAPLWTTAAVTVCADGGTTRLHRAFGTTYVPNIVCGDFDSTSKKIRETYANLGTQVVHRPDQSKNDFEKCLELISSLRGEMGPSRSDSDSSAATATAATITSGTAAAGGGVGDDDASEVGDETGVFALPVDRVSELYVFGGLDGRLDHTIANLGIVHKHSSTFSGGIVFITDTSVATLLPAGTHEIHAYASLEGPTCGLLPLAGPASDVTTIGLKWDIKNTEIAMGRYVNSSNGFASPSALPSASRPDDDAAWAEKADRRVVYVRTNAPLVWTTELLCDIRIGDENTLGWWRSKVEHVCKRPKLRVKTEPLSVPKRPSNNAKTPVAFDLRENGLGSARMLLRRKNRDARQSTNTNGAKQERYKN